MSSIYPERLWYIMIPLTMAFDQTNQRGQGFERKFKALSPDQAVC